MSSLNRIVAALAPYAKAVAAAGVALGVIATAIADGAVDADEVAAILVALGGIGAVYRVPNRPKAEPEAEPPVH